MPVVDPNNVRYGLTNEDIRVVQNALISQGFSIPAGATAYYGDQTQAAYTQFELSLGYTPGTGTANSPTAGAIAKSSVVYTKNSTGTLSSTTVRNFAYQACDKTGVPRTWVDGMSNGANLMTLIVRESSYNSNAVNNSDSNATGPYMSDGSRENCSRGLCQTIPGTFAGYHEEGTPNRIYDPLANICAAINYIRSRYGSISNVQQANPNLPPRGY